LLFSLGSPNSFSLEENHPEASFLASG